MAGQSEEKDLRSILTGSRVGEISLTRWPRVEPEQTVAQAAAAMRDARRGSCVVCVDGKLVGIFTERDLLRLIAARRPLDTPLSEAMSREPQTISTDATLLDATRLMNEGRYRRLPVLDASGEPMGILDVKAIIRFLVEHFPEAVYTQADHAHLIARSREGA